MQSLDLDLDELFDREAVGDGEDVGAHATLPELDEDGDGPMRQDDGDPDTQQDGMRCYYYKD
jgi:hypothetical protein